MSNQALQLAQKIAQLSPAKVVRDEDVRQQFISVYNAIWHDNGDGVYEREANFFQRLMRENQTLQECTSTSVYFAFIDLAVQGLTLEPGSRALAYLLPRSRKVTDANGKIAYERNCNLTISGYGELYLRARAGQIHHADNPVVVYEGDDFDFGEQNGQKFVNFRSRIPRQSSRIVACFMKITRMDGTVDYAVMVEDDWKRLQGYSAKNNTVRDKQTGQYVQKPNELYTSANGNIDPAFLMAKCIKHAFKSYPKLNIGRGTQLETVAIDQPDEQFNPYGGVDVAVDAHNSEAAPTQAEPKDFGPHKDTTAGVTVNADDDDTF
jgi:recombinational DNA repair protein RecT